MIYLKKNQLLSSNRVSPTSSLIMLSKIFAVCSIAVLVATDVAASIEPGIYKITNVASYSTIRAYSEQNPIFVSSTREYPGPFELFDIQNADGSSGYTIKNVGLDKLVSAAKETEGEPLFANGGTEAFSIEQAGGGQYVIKAVNKDLVWTVSAPVIPRGTVILSPQTGAPTQLFGFTAIQLHETAHSSAKFRVQEPNVGNCESKSTIFQPIRVILQYLPYVN